MIGGSAGSIPVIVALLKALPASLAIPVVLVIHRMRNINSELDVLLSKNIKLRKVIEPEDKTTLQAGKIYLTPQNYHLLFEEDGTVSLDYSDPIHFSRPSIDVSFESAATCYGTGVLGILLSGANSDGAKGMAAIEQAGGTCIIQDPATAGSPEMPEAAIRMTNLARLLHPEQIATYLQHL